MLTDGGHRWQVLVAISALLALAGVIIPVVFIATNRSPSRATPAPESARDRPDQGWSAPIRRLCTGRPHALRQHFQRSADHPYDRRDRHRYPQGCCDHPGWNPRDISWAPDGRFAYVVNEGSNAVSVIEATTNQVTANIPTGGISISIAVLPNGRQDYVSNLDSGTLTVLVLTD